MTVSKRPLLRKPWFVLITVGCLFLSGILALSMMWARSVMEHQITTMLQSLASISVLQIDSTLVDAVHGPSDMTKPEFRTLVDELRKIREGGNSLIRYVYIMRKTKDPLMLEFVADADALAPFEELDVNKNGKVDKDEEPSYPGDPYDITDNPALRDRAFLYPTADNDFTNDQWGTLISGYAPIKTANGTVVAVLGVDMELKTYQTITNQVMPPVFLLLILSSVSSLLVCSSYIVARGRRSGKA